MDHGGIRRPTPVRLCNSLRNSGWGGGGKGVYEARRWKVNIQGEGGGIGENGASRGRRDNASRWADLNVPM